MRCSAQKRQREIDQEQQAEDQRQKERDVRLFSHTSAACVCVADGVGAVTMYVHGATAQSSMLSRCCIAAVQELKRKLWGGK